MFRIKWLFVTWSLLPLWKKQLILEKYALFLFVEKLPNMLIARSY